jgi:D-glycero-D-manno-heptose 1,7-bisphosphate phosphatase
MQSPPMKLIILDRDGVINHDSDAFIKSPAEWLAIDGSLQAIARLNQAGYKVVVATNQSGVGRGYFTMQTLNAIHQKMHLAAQSQGAEIDAVFFCPHMADDNCDCRKPKAGMLHAIAQRFNIRLKDVPVVGDSLRDLQAGFVVGCTPYLVLTGKGVATREQAGMPPGTRIFADLCAVVDHLLDQESVTDTSLSVTL